MQQRNNSKGMRVELLLAAKVKARQMWKDRLECMLILIFFFTVVMDKDIGGLLGPDTSPVFIRFRSGTEPWHTE